ncbi:TFIIB zinc-binding [Halobacillus karajensis]|uniref:TFIIB-type zinc ribbon-containing protein n=1 Tax=Halobacillus karajensis TaxID=195088 RepID=UPI0008A74F13|nr:TFIIB-type zinc ribbon-containing protein [Halobacillus karajensis]SEH78049.1 TFIIB zinc-binding [Halobacillus karajensis]
MEVRIRDIQLQINQKEEQAELVKVINGIEMYKDMDFGGFMVIDGKSYRHCSYNIEMDILSVKPVELNEDPEELEYESDFKCPYCGNVDYDAWELEDEGETYCGACGSELEYERVVTIDYNVRPKKCAPVTRV